MKLFLTSIGIEPQYKEDFIKFIDKNPNDTTLAFIPTAGDTEPDKSYIKDTRDEISDLGINVFDVDLKDEDADSLYAKLSKADIICINGGNTFYLLDWARKSGFMDIAKKLIIDDGKIYFGISAGTLLACPDISLAGWKKDWDNNIVNIKDFKGLGFIDFIISPHFIKEDETVIQDYINKTGFEVKTITDHQAIVHKGDGSFFLWKLGFFDESFL